MLTVSIAVMNPDIEMFRTMLKSLKEHTPELTQLIIVDNGSEIVGPSPIHRSDDALKPEWYWQLWESLPLGHLIIWNKINCGFGRAHNQALELATGKYFAVLNDDIEFFENWSTPMIKALQDEKVGQVSIKNGQFNFLHPNGSAGMIDTDSPEYCEGSCFMMRTELAKKAGLFDADAYPVAYNEDADLSLRLRDLGYVMKNVDVAWKHYRAKTSSKVPIDIDGYRVRNAMTFKRKWNGYLKLKNFKETIVVKRGAAHGDVFLTGPIIQYIAETKDANVVLMSAVPEVHSYNPFVAGTVTMGHPVACDEILNLDDAYEMDFRKHIVDAYAETLGITANLPKHGTVYTSDKEKAKIDKALLGQRDFVTVDLSDTWNTKQWPRAHYRVLIEWLRKQGMQVYVIGVSGKPLFDIKVDRNFLNQLSIIETAELMSRAGLHIGHEGLTGHFAQALNIPHVIMYGCTSPEFVSDLSLPSLTAVVTPAACRGCRHTHAAGCQVICPRGGMCMQMITPEMVMEGVETHMRAGVVCA